MVLSTKESGLLKDMREQETLCIKKYERCQQAASRGELKNLFGELAQNEREHLKTVNEMMGGTVTPVTGALKADNCNCGKIDYTDENAKKDDTFLLQDMLAAEKHASAMYNVSVFEFSDPEARKTLNRIESEEQQHGEKLYAYMKANGMYS